MYRTIQALLILTALAATSGVSQADTVEIPIGQQGAGQPGLSVPQNGQTQSVVEQRYGNPRHKVAPVGNPPISHWDYPQFTVYFEYNRVIHSVVHPASTSAKPSP